MRIYLSSIDFSKYYLSSISKNNYGPALFWRKFCFWTKFHEKHHQYSLQEHHFYWSCERLDKSTHLTSFLVTDFNLRKTFLRRYFGGYFSGDTEEFNWWKFFLKIWKQTEDVLIDAMEFRQIRKEVCHPIYCHRKTRKILEIFLQKSCHVIGSQE